MLAEMAHRWLDDDSLQSIEAMAGTLLQMTARVGLNGLCGRVVGNVDTEVNNLTSLPCRAGPINSSRSNKGAKLCNCFSSR
jgi:hypothetical protein